MAIKRRNTNNSWMSFSDIMTTLMVIFMFIAISYMYEIQEEQKKRDLVFEEFKVTKDQLFSELEDEFREDFKKWDVVLGKDLSIKFTNPEVLFESGQIDIRVYFNQILNSFLPRYFEILLKDKYKNKISEIRIEGHTDTVPARHYDKDPYIGNVILSQLRSTEVLKFFRNTSFFKNLKDEEKKNLQFLITANGLSYGKTLDDNKELTLLTNKKINNQNSRRVEFRIMTKSEKLIEKVIRELGE